jgi:hypothetical protein
MNSLRQFLFSHGFKCFEISQYQLCCNFLFNACYVNADTVILAIRLASGRHIVHLICTFRHMRSTGTTGLKGAVAQNVNGNKEMLFNIINTSVA